MKRIIYLTCIAIFAVIIGSCPQQYVIESVDPGTPVDPDTPVDPGAGDTPVGGAWIDPVYNDPSLIYIADFDNNTLCGASFSGTASGALSNTVFHSSPNSLRVYGRTAGGNGISILLANLLPPGQTISFSAWVCPTATANAVFVVNMATTANPQGSAVNAAGPLQVKANTWTHIEGDYTVPAGALWARAIIRFGNSNCDFYADDIQIKLKNGSLPDSAIQEDLPPLKDAPEFAKRNLLIGSVVNPIVLFDPSGNRQKLLLKHYNAFAPQDELKPISVLDYDNSVKGLPDTQEHAKLNFNQVIPAYEFAKKYNLKMMAHHMIWHTQCPDWFFYEDYNTAKGLVTKDRMLKRMENYIKDELEWNQANYPGIVKMWSVVNEAFLTNGMNTSTLWYQTMGEDFILHAFEYANKYRTDPEIRLVYNDFGMEKQSSKINYCMDYMSRYKVPVDGIGFQFHIDMNSQTPATLRSNLERVGPDYEVYITEMDISGATPSDMTALQARYEAVIGAILSANVNLKCIRSHGLTDSQSWLINQNNDGKMEYPLLWDAENQAKPAYYGVMKAAGLDIQP